MVVWRAGMDREGSRHEKGDDLVDGSSIFSPTGVSLPARTGETNQTQRQVGGARWRQNVPDLWMDHRRGFVVEYQASGLQNPCGTRVMGQNLGPENGMDWTTVPRPVSIGSESLARIGWHFYHSEPDGYPRWQQQPHLLESARGLSEIESIVSLAVCEFERGLSYPVGICSDASFARVLWCRDQQYGRGAYHGSLTRNQVPPQRNHALWTSTYSICPSTQRSGGNRGNADGRNQWGSRDIWRRAYPPNPPL